MSTILKSLSSAGSAVAGWFSAMFTSVKDAFKSVFTLKNLSIHYGSGFLAAIGFGVYGIMTGGLGWAALPLYAAINTAVIGTSLTVLHVGYEASKEMLKGLWNKLFSKKTDEEVDTKRDAAAEAVQAVN